MVRMTCERDILPPLSWDFLCYLVLSTPSYEGEIQIMLWTPVSPLFFTCRSAFCTTCYNFQQKPWYKGSFGSTDQLQIVWTSSITMAQPILECSIDGRKGLLIPELMSLSWKAVRGPKDLFLRGHWSSIQNSVWQTDVTHIPESGHLKSVCVSVGTYSHFLMAAACTTEKAHDVTRHWLTCFATSGLLDTIKMYSGPAYTSEWTWQVLQQWGVFHIIGIPCSPTGQAVVECTPRMLKIMLEKQKKGELGCPHDRLARAWYVSSFLNRDKVGQTACEGQISFWYECSSQTSGDGKLLTGQ